MQKQMFWMTVIPGIIHILILISNSELFVFDKFPAYLSLTESWRLFYYDTKYNIINLNKQHSKI